MDAGDAGANTPVSPARSTAVVTSLILGYIGIYLCRKNLSVAVPLLRDAFHAKNEEVGVIASVGTVAYVLGKLAGPIVDRLGGRVAFLIALVGVAFFGAMGALAPGILILAAAYGANRFLGASGWGSMMKFVPTWFRPSKTGTVVGIISLSYVLGGIAAVLLAGQILVHGGGWRAIMGLPSLVLLVITGICFVVVRPGPLVPVQKTKAEKFPIMVLLANRQFLIVCGMSFTITLVRETFNVWGVDFLTTVETGKGALAAAALKSTTFDLAGAGAILLMGIGYDRVPPRLRRWLIAGLLALLAALLFVIDPLVRATPSSGAFWIAMVGLLVYGPYSLLAGVFAVESGGPEAAATAAGLVDAVGYVAGTLVGALLGKLLDVGGYALGFRCLAVVTVVSALLALLMRPTRGRAP